MICPNCGNMVADSRDTCQSCGAMMPGQSPYASYSDHQSYPGADQQAGAGQAGAPYGAPPKKSKGPLIALVVIIIVIIIVIAAIGIVFSGQGVKLKIKDYDISGDELTVSIKNEGSEDAKAEKIILRCNGEDEFDWPSDDIPSGKEVEATVDLVDFGMYWLSQIEIIYNGEVQDSMG
jgi:hypothetical protein